MPLALGCWLLGRAKSTSAPTTETHHGGLAARRHGVSRRKNRGKQSQKQNKSKTKSTQNQNLRTAENAEISPRREQWAVSNWQVAASAIGSWLLAVGFWAEQNQNQHLPRRPTTAGLQPTTAGLQHGGTESHGEKMGGNKVKSKIKSRERPRTLRHARKLIFLRFWYEQRPKPNSIKIWSARLKPGAVT